MQELARAKVNLSLHITGKREDGYHLLDSLVVFPDIGDVLHLTKAGFTIGGPFADGLSTTDNLVLKAAAFLDKSAGFHLEKNLPVASGIGGGSADAAAALRLLGGENVAGSAALGADVPACLFSKPVRMQGIGDQLSPLPELPEFAMVLVNTGDPVATKDIFKALKTVDNPESPPMPSGLGTSGFFRFIIKQRNDMQATAQALCPSIGAALAVLDAQEHCALARMSGSGGTCFGLFASYAEARQAEMAVQRAHPAWWVKAARV
jgi:4-diphosphocytidyl-2-C-methyl-D-erythritol kinase